MPSGKCAFCYGVSTNTCKDCGERICDTHTSEDGKCVDASGNMLHTSQVSRPKARESVSPDESATSETSEAPRRRRRRTSSSPSS